MNKYIAFYHIARVMYVAEPYNITGNKKFHDYPLGVTYYSREILRLVVMANDIEDAKKKCNDLACKSISGEYEFNKILNDYPENNQED